MKTKENRTKNEKKNFVNQILLSRKNSGKLNRSNSSKQLEETLKNLKETNLYAATDAGPENDSSAKHTLPVWKNKGVNLINKLKVNFKAFVSKFSKYSLLVSLHLMLSPQVIQSITVPVTQQNEWRARINLMSTLRQVGKKAYLYEIVKQRKSSYNYVPTERPDGIGLGLSPEAWIEAYNETIQFIKDHEGWNKGNAYLDLGGIKTIGYGHVITKYDNLPDKITQAQADSILRVDFNKALRACDRVTSLRGTKRLAIAHFIFAKGIGSFNRSNVKQKILAGEDIEEEILEWCTYRGRDGKTYHSEYSKNIRKWELEMYNR